MVRYDCIFYSIHSQFLFFVKKEKYFRIISNPNLSQFSLFEISVHLRFLRTSTESKSIAVEGMKTLCRYQIMSRGIVCGIFIFGDSCRNNVFLLPCNYRGGTKNLDVVTGVRLIGFHLLRNLTLQLYV